MSTINMPRRFGVLGSGQVGQTLAKGLLRHGYEVRIGTRSPGKLADFSRETGIPEASFSEVATWSDAIVLAVQGTAATAAMELAGSANLAGKAVLDTCNPIAEGQPPQDGVLRFFTGPNESLMERLQRAAPKARFVKAFSCVGSAFMVHPDFGGEKPTMFLCGDDAAAKADVVGVLEAFGWGHEDLGGVKAARAIEPLCQLWCLPGFLRGQWSHAFRLLKK